MTPSQVGSVTEAQILAALVSRGMNVLVPFSPMPYDLVAEKDGKFQRVQCKTGALRDGVIVFKDYSDDHESYRGLVDVIAVYCPQNGKIYWIALDKVEGGMQHLRIDPPKNGQRKKIRFAKDFELGL